MTQDVIEQIDLGVVEAMRYLKKIGGTIEASRRAAPLLL